MTSRRVLRCKPFSFVRREAMPGEPAKMATAKMGATTEAATMAAAEPATMTTSSSAVSECGRGGNYRQHAGKNQTDK
jgi:hypothetical protein